jgi:hypothetical protein
MYGALGNYINCNGSSYVGDIDKFILDYFFDMVDICGEFRNLKTMKRDVRVKQNCCSE